MGAPAWLAREFGPGRRDRARTRRTRPEAMALRGRLHEVLVRPDLAGSLECS